MKIIDISWPISEQMTGYKDTNPVSIEYTKRFDTDQVRESRICLSSHAGTHVDAPAHFLNMGATVDQIGLDKLIGSCTVLDCTDARESIGYQDLKQINIRSNDIILLKTKNSMRQPTDPFDPEFVYLNQSGAQYLVDCGIKSVGIDYLGIERNQPDHATHTLLLSNAIPIIEGLRLGKVGAGTYHLYCLPLKVSGLEAVPARAILSQ